MPLRVLLITPEFYGIEKRIKSVLKKSGYEVSWFENKTLPLDYHGTNSKFKFLRRIYFFLFSPDTRYLKDELKKIENPVFDILFSINAHIINSYLFRKLRKANPDLFSILYLWDSFSMYNWSRELRFFNRVYTFDPSDSINYNIVYKPNFFVGNDRKPACDIKHDLFFVGKFNTIRLSFLNKIIPQAENASLKCYIKLWPAYKNVIHNHLLYSFLRKKNYNNVWTKNYLLNYEATEGILISDFITANRINYEDIQHHLLASNAILDLPFPGQSGYTHRVIEALASGKKVITTNSNIRKESFFNASQIHIMDKQNPEVDCNWIKEKTTFPVDVYFKELELKHWLKSLINVEINQ